MKLLRLNLLIIFVVLGSNKIAISAANTANLRKKYYAQLAYKASTRTIRRDLARMQAKNEREALIIANKAKKRGRKIGWSYNCLRDLIKKTFGC